MTIDRTLDAGAGRYATAVLGRPAGSRNRATRLALRLASRRTEGRLCLSACRALPDWIAWPAQRRERLALLAGASAVAADMTLSLDGEAMQRVAGWLGEDALAGLLDLADEPPAGFPAPDSAEALAGLGRAVLQSALPPAPLLIAALGLPEAAAMDTDFARLHAGRAAALASLESET